MPKERSPGMSDGKSHFFFLFEFWHGFEDLKLFFLGCVIGYINIFFE